MDYDELVAKLIDLLAREKRVPYRALKRRFGLDDDYIEDLKVDIIKAKKLALDEDGEILVWVGDKESVPPPPPASSTPSPTSQPTPEADQQREPLSYTPPHLAKEILTSRSAIEGERKQVTVLFVDVSGFTSLSEKLDPEEVHQLMERAFGLMLDEVHRYGGTVNQFLGDGIMALFGAPIAHEDHPVRAVHAALGMQRDLGIYRDQLMAKRDIQFQVRMGLNTGAVVVGKIGDNLRMDYTAVGDTTNLASRLEKLAEPGAICVGETTAKAVESYFHLRPLGTVTVKGKAEPVRPYRVEGSRGVRSRFEAVIERGLTPLVGRERELALLRDRFAEIQANRGQVVFVHGEAGVGKSRLLLEFRQQVEAAGARWLVGRCVSYGHNMAYLPMIDMVRDLTGIYETDDVPTMLSKVEAGLRGVSDAVSWTVPFVRMLLALEPGDAEVAAMVPVQRRGRTAEALRALLFGLSQHQPVILFIEDLHWIDTPSEEVLQLLLESIATVPVLVLLTHRPGYMPSFGDQTYYTRLALHRLSDAQMRTMVEGVLHSAGVSGDVLELIAQRAEGNPLFIEELCKSMLEDGTLQRTDGGYRLARAISEVGIPGTIQDVITARIDRLPEASKTALQIASVIGREFTARLIERVSGMGHEAPHALGELRAVELIYEKSIFPELSYMFKHALTHDVAYASLLRQRRKDLHRHVGEIIEELYAERLPEFYETLAWHYGQGEVWHKAVDYCLESAEQARSRFAYAQAARYCEEAIDILERHGGATEFVVRVCEALGDLRSLLGHVDAANLAYDRALDVDDTPVIRRRIGNKRHQPGVVVRDGARIAYYEHGTGEPTLLFLHPLSYGIGTFQPLLERLCQEFRIITVDARGTGRSDPLPDVYLMHDYAEDVRAVVAATANQPVVFVGISRASVIGVNFAATYPHLVEKLVLTGCSYASFDTSGRPTLEYQERCRAAIEAGNREAAIRIMWEAAVSEPGCHQLVESLVQIGRELPWEIFENFFFARDPGRDLRPLLPTLHVPTLIVHGEADRMVPLEHGRYLADHIPDAQLYVFKDRCHHPQWTAAAAFAQLVRNFIRTGLVI